MQTTQDFRKLFESVPGLYLILGTDYTIIAVSDAYLRATMTVREKIVGRHLFEVFPDNPNDASASGTSNLRASLNRAIKSRKPDTMAVQKYDIRKPESEGGQFEVRYWSPCNSPVLGPDEEVLYIIHEAVDVTEFMNLERLGEINEQLKARTLQMEIEIMRRAQEIQKVNELLRISNEEYDRFFSMSLDMLCISSYDGFFKKVNPAFTATLGFSPDELCNRSYMDFIHPNDIEITRKEVEKQMLTHEPVLNFENRYRHKDGTYRLLSWKSAPTDTYMYAAARDITESRKSELELKLAKKAADEAIQELESFSYSIAHDLRAPLRSMTGFSSVLMEDFSEILPPDAKKSLTRVTDAAKKMSLMIDALLDISRISRKKIVPQPVPLSAFAADIAEELRTSQPERVASFTIAPDVVAQGDPVLMKMVVTNLLNNAWKYTRDAVGGAKIEFGVTQNNDLPIYFVRDNGAGFDMNYANKLFGVFQRLHSAQEFEGHGIGLATVHRIIRRHDGDIWAESSPGNGATFYFTI